MIDLLTALAAVALFAVPGLALCGLFPSLRGLPLPRRLGYGYLLGVTALAGALYAGSHLFALPLRAPVVVTLAALLSAPLAIPGTWRRTPPERRRRGRGFLVPAAAALATVVSLGVLADALSDPLKGWDSRMTWGTQARYVRQAGSVLPAALAKGHWFVTHPRYPLLLPVAQVAVQEAFGLVPDDPAYRALYAAFFPAFLLVLWDGASRWAGRRAAALTLLAASAMPFLAYSADGGAASACGDLPLACLTGAALVLLLRRGAKPLDALAAGLLLAGAVLTKNEGLPLALVVLTGAALRPARRGRWVRLAAAGVAPLAAFALLAAWRAGIVNRNDEAYLDLLALGTFRTAAGVIPKVLPVVLGRMLHWHEWATFWSAAPIVLLAGWRGLRRKVARPLLLACAAPPALGWAAYLISPWDPAVLADTTWNRLLVQASIPFLLLVSLALRDLLGKTRLFSNLLLK